VITTHTPESLRAFEAQIAEDFNAGKIRAPIHLAGGNENELIRIFQDIRPDDWCLVQWRSHYHALLKNVPPEQLRADILEGRSITLCYPEQRILSSAIVGGTLPIAVGIAMAIKRLNGQERVWVFVGDMTAMTGMFHECFTYTYGHDLPIRFVVENNGLSVCSDTQETWGKNAARRIDRFTQYDYQMIYPHSGAGKHVEF
jgi:TPP-dependent pyruvate/acetoin dehydrogenase alpha subunit